MKINNPNVIPMTIDQKAKNIRALVRKIAIPKQAQSNRKQERMNSNLRNMS